ncbi:IclR family transcriptional regulator domain-containing protein [Streptomyces sp. S584]|uniref:IclR family transcriptional regulator domain-containing protein n=1 Tax=Streptomyces sp. S584 TaxID=3096010 RepID=UPI002AFFAB6A|nr:IclR family transcriptional regulator C-terminal domain-containing protein [Streptomyces sp. S584]
MALGYPPLSRTTLARIAGPHLSALAGRIQDSASLAVLADDSVQYVARAATHRIMEVDITVGTRFPAYATSLGRVLLADLPPAGLAPLLDHAELRPLAPHTLTHRTEREAALERACAEGYALVDEELEAGLRSIAVPVRDRAGSAVASINVAMHSSSRTIEACLEEVLPDWVETSWGPADLDVAHCSTALALLYGAHEGMRLADSYLACGGTLSEDPAAHLYWRVLDALAFAPDAEKVAVPWRELGRTDLTSALLASRPEGYLEELFRRFG